MSSGVGHEGIRPDAHTVPPQITAVGCVWPVLGPSIVSDTAADLNICCCSPSLQAWAVQVVLTAGEVGPISNIGYQPGCSLPPPTEPIRDRRENLDQRTTQATSTPTPRNTQA